jgi:segregation and condensation protein B
MSLLFAADKPLTVIDLKRLLGESDNKRIAAALETLRARYAESGVQLAALAGGWQLRTHPANGPWVAKLVAGRPQRLSRALMETLAIVAYRQPITRPEIDEIRGVDCGPVLRTLLDRNLVRVIGKKEEVGRPILYGTTPEFLKTFSLKDLTELPTLREFHELGAAEKAEVEARAGAPGASPDLLPGSDAPMPSVEELPAPDAAEEDALLDELDRAASAANRASRAPLDPTAASEDEPSASAAGGPESES